MSIMVLRMFAILVTVVVLLQGCTRLRFVIDAVPQEDKLVETVVIRNGAGLFGGNKVALIDVAGLIADAKRTDLLGYGENPVARFSEALRTAEDDAAVRAVIIRINSPGGTVTASDVLYREVLGFRERTGRPVVMLMADVAASGGYYLACAGDEIIAHPTTVTGSIGVIMQTLNFSGGLNKIGIRADAITSGPNKSMGSPFEPMPAEHRELLQNLVNEFYDNFRNVVVTNRPMIAESDLGWITDGRVISGRRAAEIGVVDQLGDLDDALAVALERAGITDARLIKYHRPLEYVGSPYAHTPVAASQVSLVQLNIDGFMFDQPGFYYLWDPAAW